MSLNLALIGFVFSHLEIVKKFHISLLNKHLCSFSFLEIGFVFSISFVFQLPAVGAKLIWVCSLWDKLALFFASFQLLKSPYYLVITDFTMFCPFENWVCFFK
jgi:hypothetical protein